MTAIFWRRIAAFFIDYCVIALYAGVLFIVTMLVVDVLDADLTNVSPSRGQVTGFLTLTLPVFLYFFLYEKSSRKGTPGKKIMGLKVESSAHDTTRAILKRNILKFLPWEIAHTGVHWVVYFTKLGESTPIWVFVLLIVPQAIMLVYLVSVIAKSSESIYDWLAGTKVVKA